MLSFKDWLTEAARIRTFRDTPEGTTREIHHTEDIDGNRVKVLFTIRPKRKADVDFTVNDSFMVTDMRDASPRTKEKIVRHVGSVVDDWVGRNKPTELRAAANHPSKDAVYRTFMQRLAAKHGYKSVIADKGGILPSIKITDGPKKVRGKKA